MHQIFSSTPMMAFAVFSQLNFSMMVRRAFTPDVDRNILS